MDFTGKRVLVVGTGVSGIAAIRLLAAKGAKPVVLEGNEKADREQVVSRIPEGIGYDLIIGNLPEEVMDTLDPCCVKPGCTNGSSVCDQTSGQKDTGLGRD